MVAFFCQTCSDDSGIYCNTRQLVRKQPGPQPGPQPRWECPNMDAQGGRLHQHGRLVAGDPEAVGAEDGGQSVPEVPGSVDAQKGFRR